MTKPAPTLEPTNGTLADLTELRAQVTRALARSAEIDALMAAYDAGAGERVAQDVAAGDALEDAEALLVELQMLRGPLA